MKPTQLLSQHVDPEAVNALGAGPLLYGWARRTKSGLESTQRHVAALKSVFDSSPSIELFNALGGEHAINYISEFDEYHEVPYEFDLLSLPYRGPINGKDSDGQYFDETTDFMDGAIDSPPVLYTHAALNGFETDEVGDVVAKRRYDSYGGWDRIRLRKGNPRYNQLKEAHKAKLLGGSTAPVLSVYKANEDTGHIEVWLPGEISLVDMREGYAPRNRFAMAKAEVLFDNYYGDPVYEDDPSFWESLTAMFNRARELLSVKRATSNVECGDILKAEEIEKDDEVAKCETCPDGLKEQADMLKAELDEMEKAEGTADSMVKCQPCADALNWIRTVVKAGKLRVDEAFPLLESVQTLEGVNKLALIKDEIESRNTLNTNAFAKAVKVDAGETPQLFQLTNHAKTKNEIDEDYMNRMRNIANYGMPPIKETK